jgi:hypothetical protein
MGRRGEMRFRECLHEIVEFATHVVHHPDFWLIELLRDCLLAGSRGSDMLRGQGSWVAGMWRGEIG